MSKVLEIVVKAVWSLQLYQFGGSTYLQSDGGPIGNRMTMACARIVMLMWGFEVESRLTNSGIKSWIRSCYVDDGRYLLQVLEPGMRYCRIMKKIRKIHPVNMDEIEEDPRARTLREMQNIFNDIS